MIKKSNELHIKEVINLWLKELYLADKYQEVNIMERWSDIAGPMIAGQTKKIFIQNKKLHISLYSAALRENLRFEKRKFIKLINEASGSETINDIIFI